MFVLRSCKDDMVYYLRKKLTTIGRQTGDIVLMDNGVSRSHAELIVQGNKLYLESLKAQLRTSINNVVVSHKVRNNLKVGDIVKFGMSFEFRIDILQFRVATSSLSRDKASELEAYLKEIGTGLVTTINPNCTHLVVSELCPSVKVICAVILNIPMVSVDFFKELCDSTKEFPKENDFRPVIKHSIQEVKQSYFQYNEKRKTLFNGKIFVFVDEKSGKSMETMITLAGGEYSPFDPLLVSEYTRTSDNVKYIMLHCDKLDSLSLAKDVKTAYKEVCSALAACEWRAVPMQEIAFALLKCNCGLDCNPAFNRGKNLLKIIHSQDRGAPLAQSTQIMEQVIAKNTETQDDITSDRRTQEVVIPPSYDNDLDEFNVNLSTRSKAVVPIFRKRTDISLISNKPTEIAEKKRVNYTEFGKKIIKPIRKPTKVTLDQIDATINPFEEENNSDLQINKSKRYNEKTISSSRDLRSNATQEESGSLSIAPSLSAPAQTDKKHFEETDRDARILTVVSRKSGLRSNATLENPITKKAALDNVNFFNKSRSGQSMSSQSCKSIGDNLRQNKRKIEEDMPKRCDVDDLELPRPIKIEANEHSAKRQKSITSFCTVKSKNLFESPNTEDISETDSKEEHQTFTQTMASYFESRIKYDVITTKDDILSYVWMSGRPIVKEFHSDEDKLNKEALMKEYAEKYFCNLEEKFKDLDIFDLQGNENSGGPVNYKRFRKTRHIPARLKRTIVDEVSI